MTDKTLYIVQDELTAGLVETAGGESLVLDSSKTTLSWMMDSETYFDGFQEVVFCPHNNKTGAEVAHYLQKVSEVSEVTVHTLDVYNTLDSLEGADFEQLDAIMQNINTLVSAKSATEYVTAQKAEEYKKQNNVVSYMDSFLDGIHTSADTQFYPTKFPQLDKVLDGGLYEGLYVIGAISSLGKTTFSLQIADNLAKQGHDVLVFSLEMARTELMSKSISRNTALEAVKQKVGLGQAKTSRGITTGSRYANYSTKEKEIINTAVKQYAEYGQNIYIYEGVGDIGVQAVRDIVETHVEVTGKRPIVFIDYLQILAPYSERATDKQNTDKAVLELKRLSRDFKIPVWAVSSFNRGSYDKAVTMSSFKESGAVEYSADVLIGMDLHGVGTKSFNEQTAKSKEIREIDVKILKNRNGQLGEPIAFNFQAMFNYFEEAQ